ncbi:MAG: SufD family Fe-S cluster assembly protein [Candidatus Anstonellales archaeon]
MAQEKGIAFLPLSAAPYSLLEKYGLAGGGKGIFLEVPPNFKLEKEIKLNLNNQSQNLILLKKDASARLYLEGGLEASKLESYSEKTIIIAEEGAKMDFSAFILFETSAKASINRHFLISDLAKITCMQGSFGGKDVNVSTECSINKGAELSLNQLSAASPGSTYSEKTMGVICKEGGRFYFESRNVVFSTSKSFCTVNAKIKEEASGSDMAIRAKVLKEGHDCYAEVKPILEVYNNQVVAAHGAVVKEIEKEELFYLQSRGIPLQKAKKILLNGFISEVIGVHKEILYKVF